MTFKTTLRITHRMTLRMTFKTWDFPGGIQGGLWRGHWGVLQGDFEGYFKRSSRGCLRGTWRENWWGTPKGISVGTSCQAQVRSGPGLVQFTTQILFFSLELDTEVSQLIFLTSHGRVREHKTACACSSLLNHLHYWKVKFGKLSPNSWNKWFYLRVKL